MATPAAPARQFGPFVSIESATPRPWQTKAWLGVTTGIEGCDATGLDRSELVLVAAFGVETANDSRTGRPNTRVGLVCGIALLADGRFVGWEVPFGEQAVPAGYAYVGASFEAIEPHIANARRAVLRYCMPPDPPRIASAEVTGAKRQELYSAAERLASTWMNLGEHTVAERWLEFAGNVMPPP